MDSVTPRPIDILFFPFMAQGHLIPMTDLAKLFALRDRVRVSIVTTPLNAARIGSTTDGSSIRLSGHCSSISVHIIPFPSSDAALPEGLENIEQSTSLQTSGAFFRATALFRSSFERLVEANRPDCIVYDRFLPWVVDVASEHSIPALIFDGSSFFSFCIFRVLKQHSPHLAACSDAEPFLIPGLPHEIEMTATEIHPYLKQENHPMTEMMRKIGESIDKCYGVIMNSFYELEPDYARYCREAVIRSGRAWHVGPVSLICSSAPADAAGRGRKPAVDPGECLGWLEKREPRSVLYLSFGSLGYLSEAQLQQIALALEACRRPFIWVVKGGEAALEGVQIPDGLGLVIKGWAPQLMILGHPAVGGFVTHCGWNSVLEGVTAGVPLVTWPMFADQFYNEKLVTRVLGVGVEVGAKSWLHPLYDSGRPVIGAEEIGRAVERVMGSGEEAEGMRRRAGDLAEMASRAMEVGGSSYEDLSRLIEDLREQALGK